MISESLRTLERMPPSAMNYLQKAFCHIHHWDYATAAGLLLSALESRPGESVSRASRVNLAASLVVLGEHSAAEKWLNELEPECEPHSLHHLLNCHEIRAQIHFLRGDFDAAKITLRNAEAMLGNDLDGPARLLLKKWGYIVDVAQTGYSANQPALDEFKSHIRASGHWESLRSLDWELARVLRSPELAAKVYFGTPFRAFRQQILASEFGPSMPDHIVRTDARWKGGEPRLINGLTGQNMPLKFGSLPYRTSLLMLSDNYQPWTVYRLFDGLFGDEVFDPFHSPNRIYQLIDRIRLEIKTRNIPLDIRSSGLGFRLRPRDDGAVIVFDEMRFCSVEEMVLSLLKLRFRGKEFKLKDLNGLTPLSPTQNSRILRALVEDRAIATISGSAKTRRYKIKVS
ncbi:MAG: hypothetical protein AB7G93_10770 [Bdellovibrionales bacterium]